MLLFRCQCCVIDHSYILRIYADTRTCFVEVRVALCKLYAVTDARTLCVPATVSPRKAGALQA